MAETGAAADAVRAGAGWSGAWGLLPALTAACYPFLLDIFHRLVGPAATTPAPGAAVAAALVLAAAFAVPFCGLFVAGRRTASLAVRRLAYASVAAPTLYVFLGVVNFMAGAFYPDELLWCLLWAALAAAAWTARGVARGSEVSRQAPAVGRARVAHGVVALVLLCYILFHILNHLFLIEGTAAHDALRHLGETVYRAPAVEPLLVLLLLVQSASGFYLAWRWSASGAAHGLFRVFQIGSGIYLLAYVVGHMDSVFIYARLFEGIETDWRFATGFPAGMLHDPWNIRLLPHYALGVFFALTHPLTGLRNIVLAHHAPERPVNRLWLAGAAASALVAALIILAMCRVASGNA